jgi:hypothetical protein
MRAHLERDLRLAAQIPMASTAAVIACVPTQRLLLLTAWDRAERAVPVDDHSIVLLRSGVPDAVAWPN